MRITYRKSSPSFADMVFLCVLTFGVSLAQNSQAQPAPFGQPTGQPPFNPGIQPGTTPIPGQPFPGQPIPGQPIVPGQPAPGKMPQKVRPFELPPDFTPPRKNPAAANDGKELTTFDKLEKFRRAKRGEGGNSDFTNALKNGIATDPALIDRGVQMRVYKMTLHNNRRNLASIRGAIERETRNAAKFETNVQRTVQFREFYLTTMLKYLRELLSNHIAVRLNAVMIMSEMDITIDDKNKGLFRQAFTGTRQTFHEILQDVDQPVAVKIYAAMGLKRVLEVPDAALPKQDRYESAKVLAEQLKDASAHPWYQIRLLEALGSVGLLHFGSDQAFALKTLGAVMMDDARPPSVRAEAARRIGHVPLDNTVLADQLAYAYVQLAREMAAHFISDVTAEGRQDAYLRLYLAFRPVDEEARAEMIGVMTKLDERILAPSFKPKVESGYATALLLIKPILNHPEQPIPEDAVTKVDEWLATNKPGQLKLHPALPVLKINPLKKAPSPEPEPAVTIEGPFPAAGPSSVATPATP